MDNNIVDSKLIDNVSVLKRSFRKSESHTSKSKKVPSASTKFCRSGTENWFLCVESEISMTRIKRKRWN